MNLKESRRKIVMLGVVTCLLLALSGAAGISMAAASVLYVKPSASGSGDCSGWNNACTLQTALGAAGAGDKIWVAEGTHKPTSGGDRSATFQLKNGVRVYGGFEGTETSREERDWTLHETILSGDIGTVGDDSDNSFNVVTGSGTDASAILDGFTITGGNADAHYSDPQSRGGGMYNGGGSPTLTRVTFSGNGASSSGGGMYNRGGSPTLTNVTFSGNFVGDHGHGGGMYNELGSPTLTNVTFSGNSAYGGGGMYNSGGSPTLINVAFSGNYAGEGGGGGMRSWGGSPTLTNVTFSGNSSWWNGGGMHNSGGGNATLANVIFSGNSASADYWAGGGGMSNDDGNATLTNVTFSGNSADGGGGMINERGSATLTNVTFSGNSAYDGGGMISWGRGSSATLTNSILWGNEGAQIHNDSSATTISYSLVQGGCPSGTACDHVMNADPQFVDAPNGDLHLQATSPAINAGDNTAVPPDTLDLDGDGNTAEKLPWDLDGNPRIVGGIVDMGAYESEVEEEFVPEAGSVLLLGSGLAGLAGYVRLRLWRK